MKTRVELRRREQAFRTELDWLESRHSFSFGPHHDPRNTHHGLLLVSNDDLIRADKDVRLVQMRVLPDEEGAKPGYQQLDVNGELAKGGLVPIASGRGHDAAIAIRQKGAVLWGGRLKPGEGVRVPEARHAHLYVAKGAVVLEGAGALGEGDAARLTAAGTPALTADPARGAEVLIWATE